MTPAGLATLSRSLLPPVCGEASQWARVLVEVAAQGDFSRGVARVVGQRLDLLPLAAVRCGGHQLVVGRDGQVACQQLTLGTTATNGALEARRGRAIHGQLWAHAVESCGGSARTQAQLVTVVGVQ